ncbi:MAG: tetratricopeptide repeat protein, partial [bacterium]|nr:tetratricopeptide repeat protein [bacterium]
MNKTLLALSIPVVGTLLSLPVEAQYSASRSEAPRMGGWGRTSGQPRMGRGGGRMRTGGRRESATRDRNPSPRSSTVSLADLQAPKKATKAYEKARQQLSKGEIEKAEANLRKAVEIYPEYPSAWSTLGRMLRRQRKPAEAKAAYRKAIEADPKSWRSWAGLA